jgi:hypothetical protein
MSGASRWLEAAAGLDKSMMAASRRRGMASMVRVAAVRLTSFERK